MILVWPTLIAKPQNRHKQCPDDPIYLSEESGRANSIAVPRTSYIGSSGVDKKIDICHISVPKWVLYWTKFHVFQVRSKNRAYLLPRFYWHKGKLWFQVVSGPNQWWCCVFLVPDVDARGNTVTHGSILVPAAGPYVQQRGVRGHCIILHRGCL